jgi:hypothetical protein
MLWILARWSVSAAAVAYAALAMNHALHSNWQSSSPLGSAHAEAWIFAAYHWYGIAFSLVAAAGLAVLNIRPGWPHLKRRWTLLLALALALGILVPRGHHFLMVERCLDRTGELNYERQVCET